MPGIVCMFFVFQEMIPGNPVIFAGAPKKIHAPKFVDFLESFPEKASPMSTTTTTASASSSSPCPSPPAKKKRSRDDAKSSSSDPDKRPKTQAEAAERKKENEERIAARTAARAADALQKRTAMVDKFIASASYSPEIQEKLGDEKVREFLMDYRNKKSVSALRLTQLNILFLHCNLIEKMKEWQKNVDAHRSWIFRLAVRNNVATELQSRPFSNLSLKDMHLDFSKESRKETAFVLATRRVGVEHYTKRIQEETEKKTPADQILAMMKDMMETLRCDSPEIQVKIREEMDNEVEFSEDDEEEEEDDNSSKGSCSDIEEPDYNLSS